MFFSSGVVTFANLQFLYRLAVALMHLPDIRIVSRLIYLLFNKLKVKDEGISAQGIPLNVVSILI